MNPNDLMTISERRYNGGVRVKREWGSSTVTVFWVLRKVDKDVAGRAVLVEGYGKTPGERATFAKHRAIEPLTELLKKQGIEP